MGALSVHPANFKAGAVQLGMEHWRTPRHDRMPADREADRLRRVWASKLRVVSQKYAELERAIEDASFAEHAFNLAQRAAKLDRVDVVTTAVAVLGLVS